MGRGCRGAAQHGVLRDQGVLSGAAPGRCARLHSACSLRLEAASNQLHVFLRAARGGADATAPRAAALPSQHATHAHALAWGATPISPEGSSLGAGTAEAAGSPCRGDARGVARIEAPPASRTAPHRARRDTLAGGRECWACARFSPHVSNARLRDTRFCCRGAAAWPRARVHALRRRSTRDPARPWKRRLLRPPPAVSICALGCGAAAASRTLRASGQASHPGAGGESLDPGAPTMSGLIDHPATEMSTERYPASLAKHSDVWLPVDAGSAWAEVQTELSRFEPHEQAALRCHNSETDGVRQAREPSGRALGARCPWPPTPRRCARLPARRQHWRREPPPPQPPALLRPVPSSPAAALLAPVTPIHGDADARFSASDYSLTSKPANCCDKFVQYDGQRMPLLPFLGAAFRSARETPVSR